MADLVKRKSARVERRGRFTITEIEPDSPASSAAGEHPTYRTSVDVDGGYDDTLYESGEEGDGEADAGRQSFSCDSAAAPVVTSERISPFGSAVFERTNGSVRVMDSSGDGTVTDASMEAAVGDGMSDGEGDGRRVRSETMDADQLDGRRVKRKGRFTIIELSNDSPRSRRDSAEEFSNTTSISVTSAQVTQANAQNLSTSPKLGASFTGTFGNLEISSTPSALFSRSISESNTPTMRSSRSMIQSSSEGIENDPHLDNHFSSSTTMSGVGSMHSLSSSVNGVSGSHFHHMSALYGSAPSASIRHQTVHDNVASPPLKPMQVSPSSVASINALGSSYSSLPTAAINIPGTSAAIDRRQPHPDIGANRRHLASRQKAITISAEQFIQQQNTIASLIRQQHELKQLIGILAEQQQHLTSIPKHLSGFSLDHDQNDAQEQSMREAQIQVDALNRANDALQMLLSEAEQDAHERTVEIECLSNENDELRHRFSIMERKYHDEKKRSMTLEQDLQRTRRSLYAARHKVDKSDQLHSYQKHHQKMGSRSSSRELDEPTEQKLPLGKMVA